MINQIVEVFLMTQKNPLIALLLSFLFPGVGQIYNGQMMKGIILLVAYFGIIFLAFILTFIVIGICLFIVPLAIWLYAMYDAYVTANKINKGY